MNFNKINNYLFVALLGMFLVFSITGCEVNDENSESWNIDINQEVQPGIGELLVTPTYGGKVSASNSMSAIDVPIGALEEPLKVSVRPVGHEDDYIELETGRLFLGAIDFTPFGTIFKSQVKIIIGISEYKIPGSIFEVFRLETSNGVPIAFNSVDRDFTGGVKPSIWKKTSLLGSVDKSGYSVTFETDTIHTYAVIDYQGLNENLMITSISPETGATGGVVKIIGNGFGVSREDSMVYFGSRPVIVYLRWSNSLIEAVIPNLAVSSEIKIEKSGLSSNAVYMNVSDGINPPRIDSVFPESGSRGSTIKIRGARFGTLRNSSVVKVSGVEAVAYPYWSDTEILFGLPNRVVNGDLSVIVNSIKSNSSTFVVVSTQAAEPNITGVSPEAISIGDKAVLSGYAFGSVQGTSVLGVNGVMVQADMISGWTDKEIEFTVPVGASDGNICLSVNDRTSNGFPCKVSQPIPIISSISPLSAYSGDTLTISGSGFGILRGLSVVKINQFEITEYLYWDDTRVMFKVPEGMKSGPLSITVLGRMSNTLAFRFIESALWSVNDTYLDGDVRDIAKSPSNIIFACGGNETGSGFIRRHDGTNWQAENIPVGNSLNTLLFSGSDILAAGGKSSSSFLLKYSSGTWEEITLTLEKEIFQGTTVPGKSDLWFACENGKFIYYDTVNWNTLDAPTESNIYTIEFVTSSEAWAGGGDSSGGSGVLMHYISSRWTKFDLPVNNAVYKIIFDSQNRGWAFCSGGVILFYNGASWSTVDSPAVYNLYDAFFLDPYYGWACGENGTMIRYFDGRWEIDNTIPTTVTRYSIFLNAQKDGWSGGEQGNLIRYSE